MNNYKYNPNFMPLQYPDYCGTTCFMGILNYFWWTNFNPKDTWDMAKIATLGKYKFNNEYEMLIFEVDFAYALHRLGFYVEIFSGLKENEFNSLLENPNLVKNYLNPKLHKFIKGNTWIEGRFKRNIFDKDLYEKILDEKVKINFLKENHEKEIVVFIKNNQGEDVLFMVGLNYNVLYDVKEPDERYSGGHIVVCKSYKDDKFEIYDPLKVKNPVFIDKDVFIKAIIDFGFYEMVLVKNVENK